MTQKNTLLALGATVVGLLLLIWAQPAQAEESEPHTTYVLVFTTSKCPPCERLKRHARPLVEEGFPIFILSDPNLAAEWRVRAFPTSFGVRGGKIIDRRVGVLTTRQLRSLIEPTRTKQHAIRVVPRRRPQRAPCPDNT